MKLEPIQRTFHESARQDCSCFCDAPKIGSLKGPLYIAQLRCFTKNNKQMSAPSSNGQEVCQNRRQEGQCKNLFVPETCSVHEFLPWQKAGSTAVIFSSQGKSDALKAKVYGRVGKLIVQ